MQHTGNDHSIHRAGFVALAGCPNVGKSTLMNRLLGEKVAIATPMPQTTRRTIRGVLTLPGSQIVFLDTPGIHIPRQELNQRMVAAAYGAIGDADVVVFLADGGRPPGEGDRSAAAACLSGGRPVVLVINKWDTVAESAREDCLAAYRALGDFAATVTVSALDAGCGAVLLPELISRLPESPPLYPDDQISDQTLRDIVSELVREQVILTCAQEVPHAVAVEVERYDEEKARPDGGVADHVWAVIYVERDSQKGILVGKGGHRIKAIGSAARKQMETVVGRPVHLKLFVKLKKDWRKDGQFLNEMGYRV